VDVLQHCAVAGVHSRLYHYIPDVPEQILSGTSSVPEQTPCNIVANSPIFR
jgi:hypothetical protein